jgi:hypothetical protein
MSGVGHNGGPSMGGGVSWRRHCWSSARESLMPTLPIEVVRLRVKRAKAPGLDYRTYAGVRATTGHDVVAFLFSSNALRVSVLRPAMAEALALTLADVQCGRLALAVAPLTPGWWRRPILGCWTGRIWRRLPWRGLARFGRCCAAPWARCRRIRCCWWATWRWCANGARRGGWRGMWRQSGISPNEKRRPQGAAVS